VSGKPGQAQVEQVWELAGSALPSRSNGPAGRIGKPADRQFHTISELAVKFLGNASRPGSQVDLDRRRPDQFRVERRMLRKRARLLVKQPDNNWPQLIPNGHDSYATGRQPTGPADYFCCLPSR
jgi:hypothetical protein